MDTNKPKSNRNRTAGHGFERFVAEVLRKAGFEHVVTCRSENRTRDGEGVDLINSDEFKNGRLPYNVQCKNMVSKVDYHALLKSMPKNSTAINVVFHKFTEKKKGGAFHPKGHYAILDMQDFINMAARLKKLEELAISQAADNP